MSKIREIVDRQKDGAQFVISAQMLRLSPEEFDLLAQTWVDQGGPGFTLCGVPHRKCMDNEFFIDRVTAVKTPA